MTVDDGAFAVSPLIELAHTVLAQQRQIVHDFLKVFARPGLSGFAEIRAACHNGISVACSPFVRPVNYSFDELASGSSYVAVAAGFCAFAFAGFLPG